MKWKSSAITKSISIGFYVFFATGVMAQETCKVLMESISVKYEGACKNGKAHGQGKASGIDTYEGEFKKGLPDGKGKYTWANGNYYEGGWKDGIKNGESRMVIKKADGTDSVITGTWKNDELAGGGKPYRILSKSGNINRIQANKKGNSTNQVKITVLRMNNKVDISNLRITSDGGNFFSDNFVVSQFPIDANIEFQSASASGFGATMEQFKCRVNIAEAGTWEIVINLVNI